MKNVNFKVLFALCLLGNLGFLWAIYEVQNENLLYLKEVSKSLSERFDYKSDEAFDREKKRHMSEWLSSRDFNWRVKKDDKRNVGDGRKLSSSYDNYEPFAVDENYVWYRKRVYDFDKYSVDFMKD